MNGTREMLNNMAAALRDVKTENQIIICPPFTLLGTGDWGLAKVGAQDCSIHNAGAYTGEISAQMIADTGAKYVIVGHSERRQYHGETNEIVRQKASAAIAAGLTPIICVGETLSQKENSFEIITQQITESIPDGDFIIAYEPVWAIGTGLTPTTDEIAAMHEHMRGITTAKLLYGGSVKGTNAAEIMSIPNVDGVLVGGASLDPDNFVPIITAV